MKNLPVQILQFFIACAVVITLSACSGKDDNREPSPGKDGAASDKKSEIKSKTKSETRSETNANRDRVDLHGVRLIDAGSEPRFLLSIDQTTPVKVNVSASSETEGTMGDKPFTDAFDSRYQLGVHLVGPETSKDLVARFQAKMASSSDGNTVTWEWQLSSNGVLTKVEPPSVSNRDRHSEHLNTPVLFLMVPGEPVGSGAKWTYADAEYPSPVEIQLDSINELELSAKVSMKNEMKDSTVSVVASGNWDRHLLIARQVKSRVNVFFKAKTTRNGEEVDMQVSKVVEHEYKVEK